jgi:CRP-like cAMP-binding protein
MITTLTRATDPRTSLEAAILMDATGTATKHRIACLAEVRRLPGQTAAEIAKAIGLERHEPSRRLPELRTAGDVRNGLSRICTVQGHRSMTWWPVEAKP